MGVVEPGQKAVDFPAGDMHCARLPQERDPGRASADIERGGTVLEQDRPSREHELRVGKGERLAVPAEDPPEVVPRLPLRGDQFQPEPPGIPLRVPSEGLGADGRLSLLFQEAPAGAAEEGKCGLGDPGREVSESIAVSEIRVPVARPPRRGERIAEQQAGNPAVVGTRELALTGKTANGLRLSPVSVHLSLLGLHRNTEGFRSGRFLDVDDVDDPPGVRIVGRLDSGRNGLLSALHRGDRLFPVHGLGAGRRLSAASGPPAAEAPRPEPYPVALPRGGGPGGILFVLITFIEKVIQKLVGVHAHVGRGLAVGSGQMPRLQRRPKRRPDVLARLQLPLEKRAGARGLNGRAGAAKIDLVRSRSADHRADPVRPGVPERGHPAGGVVGVAPGTGCRAETVADGSLEGSAHERSR